MLRYRSQWSAVVVPFQKQLPLPACTRPALMTALPFDKQFCRLG